MVQILSRGGLVQMPTNGPLSPWKTGQKRLQNHARKLKAALTGQSRGILPEMARKGAPVVPRIGPFITDVARFAISLWY